MTFLKRQNLNTQQRIPRAKGHSIAAVTAVTHVPASSNHKSDVTRRSKCHLYIIKARCWAIKIFEKVPSLGLKKKGPLVLREFLFGH